MDDARDSRGRTAPRTDPLALRLVIVLAALGTLGAVVMAVAHLGVDLPLLPTVGLGRPVPPAVAAFTLGATLFALLTWGLARRSAWSWALGLLVNAVALAGSAMPYRGAGSAVGIVLTGLALALLLAPPTRTALLGRSAN